jgi:stalled ribosome alternative rescue factor ArfA
VLSGFCSHVNCFWANSAGALHSLRLLRDDLIQPKFIVKKIFQKSTILPVIMRTLFAQIRHELIDHKANKGKGAYRHQHEREQVVGWSHGKDKSELLKF